MVGIVFLPASPKLLGFNLLMYFICHGAVLSIQEFLFCWGDAQGHTSALSQNILVFVFVVTGYVY